MIEGIEGKNVGYKLVLADAENDVLFSLHKMFAENDINKRWLSIAKTHFEQGFMAAQRALLNEKQEK